MKSQFIPAIQGLIAFAAASALASIMILQYDNYFSAAILTGGLGALLLSLLRFKNKLTFWKMALAGSIGMPVGLLLSFSIVGGIGELIPPVGNFFENTPVPDIVAVMMVSTIYGMFLGGINFGKKAIGRFAVVCGIVSVPAGVLVSVFNALEMQTVADLFDLNFVTIMLFIGLGVGLAIGDNKSTIKHQ